MKPILLPRQLKEKSHTLNDEIELVATIEEAIINGFGSIERSLRIISMTHIDFETALFEYSSLLKRFKNARDRHNAKVESGTATLEEMQSSYEIALNKYMSIIDQCVHINKQLNARFHIDEPSNIYEMSLFQLQSTIMYVLPNVVLEGELSETIEV